MTLHGRAGGSFSSDLFSQVYWLVHPIFNFPLIVQKSRNLTLKNTLQLVRVTKITSEQNRNNMFSNWNIGVKTSLKTHTYLSSMQSQSKSGVEEPWNRSDGGHSIILINFPIESVSKSPQDKQNEQSHSQSSSWWAKISLCKVESHRVKISCSMHTQNLTRKSKKEYIYMRNTTHTNWNKIYMKGFIKPKKI